MKNVVILSKSDLHFGNSAAAARMNMYAKSLACEGVDVFLFSTQMDISPDNIVEIQPHIFVSKKKKITKRNNNFQFIQSLTFLFSVRKYLDKRINGYSILNYSTTPFLFFDLILMIVFRSHKVFCEVNEVRKFASENKNRLVDRIYCALLEKTYPHYDGLIFISRKIEKFYCDSTHRSIVIPILSDMNVPFVNNYHENKFDVVFIGSISFAKENIEELLKGFLLFSATNHNARLLFYGNVSTENQTKLDGFIKENNLFGKIIYCGEVKHDNVIDVMYKADALIISRKNNNQNNYGFSTKLSEYAISGVPIIMTDTGVVKDYFRDGVDCIICDGYDSIAFQKSFERLAEMYASERRILTKNAYSVALRHFDYRLYSKSLTSFLLNN